MSNNYSVNEVSTGIGGFLIFLALIGFMVAVSYAGLSENWQALAGLGCPYDLSYRHNPN